jgi:S1-C subfamily serine protease
VRKVVAQLQAHGSIPRGWLGVSVENAEGNAQGGGLENELSPSAGARGGVKIAGVEPNSPASRAGVRRGDVVVSVDGEAVHTSLGLVRDIAERAPDTKVVLRILRAGRTVSVPVIVGRRPAETAE